jgi:hypothetical protein
MESINVLPMRCSICGGLAQEQCADPCPSFPSEEEAAREVVRQARGYLAMFYGTPELRRAVAIYDQAAQGG